MNIDVIVTFYTTRVSIHCVVFAIFNAIRGIQICKYRIVFVLLCASHVFDKEILNYTVYFNGYMHTIGRAVFERISRINEQFSARSFREHRINAESDFFSESIL